MTVITIFDADGTEKTLSFIKASIDGAQSVVMKIADGDTGFEDEFFVIGDDVPIFFEVITALQGAV